VSFPARSKSRSYWHWKLPVSSSQIRMGRGEYRDREERLTNRKPGHRATSSQDLIFVVFKLYALSARDAKRSANGNWSGYAYAGLPEP